MHAGSSKFLKNATSNLVAGGASAMLAIVLPHYFVRCFRPAEFSLWVLVLQLAAYVNFLNFGLQTAIGRYVAYALGREDRTQAEQILSAGLQMLTALAGLGICVIAIVAWLLPIIFRKIDPALISTARIMLFWTGGAMTIGLPFSAFAGVFIGLQRNEVPAVSALVSKGFMALALIWVGEHTHNLISAAHVFFEATVAGYLLQYVWFRHACRSWRVSPLSWFRNAHRELISYCASLTVWSVGMLLVGGLDITVVGIFDFKDVGAYGVSASVAALFIGFFNSVTSPLLQVFAKCHARQRIDAILNLLHFTSWLVAVLSLALGCWIVLPSREIFSLWVGPGLAFVGVRVFAVLVLANVIRMLAAPYANYLIAAGMQRRVYLSPLAEGITNLLVSLAAAHRFGAIGVAWGTVAGGVMGIAANYAYNFARTLPTNFSILEFFASNIGYPLLAVSPMLCVLGFAIRWKLGLTWSLPLMLLANLPAVALAWHKYRGATRLIAGDSPPG